MKNTPLLSVILLLVVANIFAQSSASISGSVRVDNKPAIGIEVTLTPETSNAEPIRVITDADGRYAFSSLRYGSYMIRVQSLSFAQLVTIKENEKLDFDILQGPSLPSITRGPVEQVTVIATGSQRYDRFVPKTVDLIDGQEMRDRADFSLVESLRTIPGMRIQQLGGFGKAASIKTRGLRNQDTALLIDGIRFRDPSAITGDASAFLPDFTLTSVSRIEVLRGPGSSLYGTNAIGGTVDFRTARASAGTHGQVSVAAGGLGLKRYRGNISYGDGTGDLNLVAGGSHTDYSKGIDGDDDARNSTFQASIGTDKFAGTSILGRIYFSDAAVNLNSDPDTLGALPTTNATIITARPGVNFIADVNDPDRRQNSKSFNGAAIASHMIGNYVTILGHYQLVDTSRTNNNGLLGAGFQSASTSIFEGTINTANARVIWIPDGSGKNTMTAGYEYEREDFRNEGRTPSGAGNFSTEAGQSSSTAFAQHLVSLNEGRFQLAFGGRVQRYSLDRPAFSISNAPYGSLTLDDPPTAYTFDGAASYYFRSTGTKVRAHVGNGYRVPSLYERFGTFFSSFGTPSFVALGDPFLKPEKTIGFDAGIDQDLADARVRLSATYFYTRLTDIIGYGNVVPNIGSTQRPFGGYENQRGGISRGGEFSAKFKPAGSTDISASYTLTNSDQLLPQVTGNPSRKTLGVPDHQFTLVATQRFRKFWINFDFLATSTYLAPIFSGTSFSTYVYRFEGNRRGDLTAGYTFDLNKNGMNLRVFGTIENVFNQEYFENGFRTAKANARLGVSYSF